MSNSTYTLMPPTLKRSMEPKLVCCTSMTTIKSEEQFPYQPLCLQIIALPVEYNTVEGVTTLLTQVMMIGEPNNIQIIEKKNYNHTLKMNIVTRSALIDFKYWHNTNVTRDLYSMLNQTKSDKVYTRVPSVTVVISDHVLHWDNGDIMTHLSFREARPMSIIHNKTDSVVAEKLVLSETDWNSLYIPILPNNMQLLHPDKTITVFQPKHLQSFIENDLKLGKVARIDIIDRKLDNIGTVKAVFIHFEYWNNNQTVANLRSALGTQEHYRQHGYHDGNNFHKFLVRDDNGDKVPGYFVFKINHKPIPEAETELNMAQLVAANKVLTEKMAERDEEISKLKAELLALREKVVVSV
jgi:hypothetical protein